MFVTLYDCACATQPNPASTAAASQRVALLRIPLFHVLDSVFNIVLYRLSEKGLLQRDR